MEHDFTTEWEVSFKFEYVYHQGQAQTWDDPGYPDEVELIAIYLYGVALTPDQEEAFIKEVGQDTIDEILFEDAAEQFASEQEIYADFKYNQWKEEKRGIA